MIEMALKLDNRCSLLFVSEDNLLNRKDTRTSPLIVRYK